MAFKFEIIDGSLVVTDTGPGTIFQEYPKRDMFFNNNKLKDGIVEIYDTNAVNEMGSIKFELDLVDCEDDGGTPFTQATFRDFARANLGKASGGGSGTGWTGQVDLYANLPITIGVPAIGSIYLVEQKTTILFGAYTTRQSGLYIKDLDTGSLSDWRRLNVKVNFTDGEFAIVSAADESKRATFDLSLLTTANTRTYQYQDRDYVIAGIDDRGLESFFLQPRGEFGGGGAWADAGFIALFPVLLFASGATERAVYQFYALARVKLDQVDPEVSFITYSTGAPSAAEAVRWSLSCKYKAQGDALGGAADQVLLQTQVLTDLTANTRQSVVTFTLDRTLISDQDVVQLNLERIGGDVLDTYGSDIGVGQSGMVVQTTKFNP